MQKETEIVVIGAGLTGLTLAHCLEKSNSDFLVIERSDKTGGVIQTVRKDGFLFETGPNTGVLGNEQVMDLFDDLRDYCRLEVAGDSVNKRYILKNGQWEAMPMSLIKGITTPLFTLGDKLRILGEPFRKPGTNPNETLDQLVVRRMGKSFLNYAIDPFILGVYAGDPSYLVPRFALPKLYNLEQKYGSFIGGTIKMAKEKKKSGIKTRANRKIFSVEGGLENLTTALSKSAGIGKFLTGVENIEIHPEGTGYRVAGIRNRIPVNIRAQKVVTTVGAHELSLMLPFLEKGDLMAVTNLLYARVTQASVGFRTWKGMPLDGFGGLIPFSESRDILGVLFPSAFLSNRAPEGGAMLSVFLGGVRKNHLFDQDDTDIREIVAREMISLMGIKEFKPDVFQLSRYHHAIPQYGADCEARFEKLDQIQSMFPGLFIAGNLRNGIGMADRIKQGFDLAEILK
jgi:oxygen-dependent protoporphyrinogen oxidase